MTSIRRRDLLAASAAVVLLPRVSRAEPAPIPVAVSSANGIPAVKRACELLDPALLATQTRTSTVGRDHRPVHAAVQGVSLVENDPKDMSVGLGGLPNENGVVQLDACVMEGTTGLGGAVAAIENIQNPSQVALRVMDRTDHVLLVGKGAYRFARAHGFRHAELLTEAARKRWLRWKENLSDKDDWIPPERDKGGTITCLARAPNGHMGGCTTTSGLAYKIPSRVGDSPIIGAGLYVDDTAGAAGCTGRGEACILNCASFLAVEFMRQGRTAMQAALETCRRIVARTKAKRLLNAGRPAFNVKVYCLRNDGTHGAASIWSGGKYAVRDAKGARLEPAQFVFKRS